MKIEELAHTKNATLEGKRKALYAQDTNGNLQVVASNGWEAEELVTQQAVEAFYALRNQALKEYQQGQCSSLKVWMYHCRMDEALLSQASGVWQWRVKRHLKANNFKTLSTAIKQKYADAFNIQLTQLESLPLIANTTTNNL